MRGEPRADVGQVLPGPGLPSSPIFGRRGSPTGPRRCVRGRTLPRACRLPERPPGAAGPPSWEPSRGTDSPSRRRVVRARVQTPSRARPRVARAVPPGMMQRLPRRPRGPQASRDDFSTDLRRPTRPPPFGQETSRRRGEPRVAARSPRLQVSHSSGAGVDVRAAALVCRTACTGGVQCASPTSAAAHPLARRADPGRSARRVGVRNLAQERARWTTSPRWGGRGVPRWPARLPHVRRVRRRRDP